MLELIQQQRYRVRKIVVASSVGVYGEGAYRCSRCGPCASPVRPLAQLETRAWEPRCPRCEEPLVPVATSEDLLVSPEKAYSISKFDQERLVLAFGRDYGIGCCALRYFLTYGPRQSLTNPYTGVISIFASRIVNGLSPIVFEDGGQSRDFVYVDDVASANVLALEDARADGQVFNVGSGVATSIIEVARLLAELIGRPDVAPELPFEYRPGESRHIFADISRIRALGFTPLVSLREGLERYINWVRDRGRVEEYLSSAMVGLRHGGVVRRAREDEPAAREDSLSIVIPAYNEAGNLESLVRYVLSEVETFIGDLEVLVVNDGSHDGTGLIADRLAAEDRRVRVIHHPFNVGYGGAQKSGLKYATRDWVVFVPADHEFDVRDLRKFLEVRDVADIIGSFRIVRYDSPLRRIISRFYNIYMRWAYGVRLRDLNWVKMFRRSIFESIEIESPGFGVDAEIVVKACLQGRRVTEIAVTHHLRTWGRPTGVSFKNVYRTARELRRLKKVIKRAKASHEESKQPLEHDASAVGAASSVAGGEAGALPGAGRPPVAHRGSGR
jgi:dTDP-L-rhamnose 4-epimerase